jgi:hypothetical protein
MDGERRARLEQIRATYPAGTLLDEAHVPAYTLPDPLVCADGTPVTDAVTWWQRRRPEVFRLCEEQIFGRSPEPPAGMRFELRNVDRQALGGRATRKEVRITLRDAELPKIDLLLYVPNGLAHPPATWVGLNYLGNQSIVSDPGVSIFDGWVPDMGRFGRGAMGVVANRATEESRGTWLGSMPVERLIERGFAVANACCGICVRVGRPRPMSGAYWRPGPGECAGCSITWSPTRTWTRRASSPTARHAWARRRSGRARWTRAGR